MAIQLIASQNGAIAAASTSYSFFVDSATIQAGDYIVIVLLLKATTVPGIPVPSVTCDDLGTEQTTMTTMSFRTSAFGRKVTAGDLNTTWTFPWTTGSIGYSSYWHIRGQDPENALWGAYSSKNNVSSLDIDFDLTDPSHKSYLIMGWSASAPEVDTSDMTAPTGMSRTTHSQSGTTATNFRHIATYQQIVENDISTSWISRVATFDVAAPSHAGLVIIGEPEVGIEHVVNPSSDGYIERSSATPVKFPLANKFPVKAPD